MDKKIWCAIFFFYLFLGPNQLLTGKMLCSCSTVTRCWLLAASVWKDGRKLTASMFCASLNFTFLCRLYSLPVYCSYFLYLLQTLISACFLSSHTQLDRWTSLRSAAPSWRPPSLRPRWCTEAPSSTRGPWQGDPSRPPPPLLLRFLLLPSPPHPPPACLLWAPWLSPPPALRTLRPCTTAYLRPVLVTSHRPAVQFPTTSLHSGQHHFDVLFHLTNWLLSAVQKVHLLDWQWRNLIGPLECYRQKVCLVTIQTQSKSFYFIQFILFHFRLTTSLNMFCCHYLVYMRVFQASLSEPVSGSGSVPGLISGLPPHPVPLL